MTITFTRVEYKYKNNEKHKIPSLSREVNTSLPGQLETGLTFIFKKQSLQAEIYTKMNLEYTHTQLQYYV